MKKLITILVAMALVVAFTATSQIQRGKKPSAPKIEKTTKKPKQSRSSKQSSGKSQKTSKTNTDHPGGINEPPEVTRHRKL